jgi:hypothetical protein
MPKTKLSVDDIILTLPRHEQVIVKKLRTLVLECLPRAVEKNNWGAPFYTRNRMICFIWPPSVSWGPKRAEALTKGVTLGFCQGNLMSNENGRLLAEGRKQVYCMYFTSVDEINEEEIKALLYEADMVDEFFRKKRKQKR